MAQPNFGTSGLDSFTDGRSLETLELNEGIDVRLFRRMSRPSHSAQVAECNAWGITAPVVISGGPTLWPQSVTLTQTEEGMQHEVASGDQPEEANATTPPTNNASDFKCHVIMRVRGVLSVTAKVETISGSMEDIAWPADFTPALLLASATFPVGLATLSGTGEPLLTSVEKRSVNNDWDEVSYQYTFITPNPDTTTYSNILDVTEFSFPTIADHWEMRSKTLALSVNGFATSSGSVQYFPKHV